MMGRESACFLIVVSSPETLLPEATAGEAAFSSLTVMSVPNKLYIHFPPGEGGDLNGGGAFFLCNNPFFKPTTILSELSL